MANNKYDSKNEWEKEHVQRVLDFYNNKYGSNIIIKGKSTEVYPDLKGHINWDWVCYDTKTEDEIALEVKRITNPKLEKKSHILWQLLGQIQSNLNESGVLKGTYHMSLNIPREYSLPSKKIVLKELKDTLYKAICEAAPKLKIGNDIDLIPKIKKELSFTLLDLVLLTLHKLDDKGSSISKGSGMTGCESIDFDATELEEFEQLIGHANEQLGKSNAKMAFLVLIEEGYRTINPSEVAEAFGKMEPTSYSQMDNIYFIRSEEIFQIPLPTPEGSSITS